MISVTATSLSNWAKWYISNLPESKYGDFDILYTNFNKGGYANHTNFYYISQKNDNNFRIDYYTGDIITYQFYFYYEIG